MNNHSTSKNGLYPSTYLACGLLLSLALAGCLGVGHATAANQAPVARLDLDRRVAWTGENFGFHGNASYDPDGNITGYRFDFGDGSFFEAKSQEDAKTQHAYPHGGEYGTTLTVTDNGRGDNEPRTSTVGQRIAVNQRWEIPTQVIYVPPANATPSSKYVLAFNTSSGVDRYELNVSLSSSLLAGSSEIVLKILRPDHSVLEERHVIVDAGQTQNVDLAANLPTSGLYTLEVGAKSGGASLHGELRVYYDEGIR